MRDRVSLPWPEPGMKSVISAVNAEIMRYVHSICSLQSNLSQGFPMVIVQAYRPLGSMLALTWPSPIPKLIA